MIVDTAMMRVGHGFIMLDLRMRALLQFEVCRW